MNQTGQAVQRHIEVPNHPVPRKYIEPILFLADRMSSQDRITPAPAKRMVDQLAEALQIKDFRRQPWYRQQSEQQACKAIDLETAKRGTLVVLTLVMKADTTRGEVAKAFFSRMRQALDMEPIAVPAELDEHKSLALRYLVG